MKNVRTSLGGDFFDSHCIVSTIITLLLLVGCAKHKMPVTCSFGLQISRFLTFNGSRWNLSRAGVGMPSPCQISPVYVRYSYNFLKTFKTFNVVLNEYYFY